MMRPGPPVAFVGSILLCVACESDPAPPPPTSSEELVHVVGDAGLTGTRFCVFISRGETTASGRTCSEPREFQLFTDKEGKQVHCVAKGSYDIGSSKLPVTATGGLQDLVDDPDKARELVQQGVSEVEQGLAGRDKKITAGVVLGTSGFRDEQGKIIEGKFDGLWTAVRSVFEKRNIPVVTRALRLEEEARWSWTTIRFLRLQNKAFSIIESGGGSCHFATGENGAEYADIKSASDSFGLQRAWQTFAVDDVRQEEIPAFKDPAFKPCYSGTMADATGQDAVGCAAFLQTHLFDNSAIARTSKEVIGANRFLYGTGPAWNGLITTYFPDKASVTLEEIHAATVTECSRPQKDGLGFIKHQGCFALAFQETFLRTVAGAGAIIRNGIESWPRGASISPGGEFPACKDSTIKITIDSDPGPGR